MSTEELWILGGYAIAISYAIRETHIHGQMQAKINARLQSMGDVLYQIQQAQEKLDKRLDLFLTNEIRDLKAITSKIIK